MTSTSRPRTYLAAPLFTPLERFFNRSIRDELSPFLDVVLPQEAVGLLDEKKGNFAADVFAGDLSLLRSCDILVVVLDGPVVDEGACFELGYFFGQGRPCYGLQ